jgi:aminoglycoside phosphotransferase (APT) family kinase protein
MKLIPEARRGAVDEALRAAFGARAAGDWRPISGGASGALILRFEVAGRGHVLRLEPERIARVHRQRHYDCMTAGAQVGAAPPVHYVDVRSGVAIMDFVAGRPLGTYPGGPLALARALGELTARVRTAPLFPAMDYPQLCATLLRRLARSGLFAPGLLGPHAEGLARIREALPWDAGALVSSHNDPNPRNLLFDGERLWLIDWELGAANDPLADLAILTCELAEGPELEAALLTAAFGRPPDRAMRARLEVIRLLTRLFYGVIILANFQPGPDGPEPTLDAFTIEGFRAAVKDGRLKAGEQATAYAFGKTSLGAFLDGVRGPGFEAALAAVRG